MLALQVLAGSVASIVMGMVWYSPSVFGKVWFKHQFPQKKFGECDGGMASFYITIALMIIQATLLSTVMNALKPMWPEYGSFQLLFVPALISSLLAILIACVTLPHYLFGRRGVTLFLVCFGHDVVQVTAAVFVIFALGLF